jgi:SH3-like domain-containing protein
MGKYYDAVAKRAKRKQKIAENSFKLIYESDEERENKKEILDVVLEQISVCEDMFCPIEIETIIDWIRNKTVRQIEREAHELKFAS